MAPNPALFNNSFSTFDKQGYQHLTPRQTLDLTALQHPFPQLIHTLSKTPPPTLSKTPPPSSPPHPEIHPPSPTPPRGLSRTTQSFPPARPVVALPLPRPSPPTTQCFRSTPLVLAPRPPVAPLPLRWLSPDRPDPSPRLSTGLPIAFPRGCSSTTQSLPLGCPVVPVPFPVPALRPSGLCPKPPVFAFFGPPASGTAKETPFPVTTGRKGEGRGKQALDGLAAVPNPMACSTWNTRF